MLLIQPHMPVVIVVRINQGDPIGLLQHPHAEIPEQIRQRVLQAHVVRIRIGDAGRRDFAELLDRLCGRGLEDRIGVIADQHAEIAGAGWQPGLVPHRPRTRQRRAEAESWMEPRTGKIRNRCAGWRAAANRRGRGRRYLPKGRYRGRCRNRSRQCDNQNRMQPPVHAPLAFTVVPVVADEATPFRYRPGRGAVYASR